MNSSSLKKYIAAGFAFFSINAFSCTSLTVSPVTGFFSANNNTTLLTGHIDVFCSNKTDNPIAIKIVYRNDTNSQNRSDFGSIYKDGQVTSNPQKTLNFQMLNINLRSFDREEIVFSPGESTKQIKYFMKPLNLKKIEAGSYNGFLPFEMEY